ncbi:MAG: PIG-L deacetylase family protein [Chloroflexota bacterium]
MQGRILIIAAHPDDGVLGCGGTIARLVKQGREVALLVVTSAYTPDWSKEYVENQKKEVQASNKILGIARTTFLDFPAVKLDMVSQKKLNDSLLEVVSEFKPDTIYVPHKGDLNRDHRIVFEATLVAARPVSGRVKSIFSFSTMESGFMVEPFIPNVYIDISDTFDIKLEAVKAYESEVRPYPHPRSPEVIRALAQKWGSESGLGMAEAFILVRGTIDRQDRL